jgi:DNA-binding response OmpR family regulator
VSPQTRTVLLVEDDPDLRDAVEIMLFRKGYHVVSTGDGQRAIQLASQHRVDAALVDLLIPGQSGFQVTTDLKTIFGEGVKVAVMSGNASHAHRDYAFAAGAERFLSKPFTVSQLFEAVTALCPLPTDTPPTGHRRTVRIG